MCLLIKRGSPHGHFSLGKRLKAQRNTCPRHNFLTLPLTEESVIHHSHLVPEMYMLTSWQGLHENVCYLLISGYILKLESSLLNTITDEVLPDLYMFRPIVKNWILREFYATLIITANHCLSQPLTKPTNQHLEKPYGLTASLTRYHILCYS